MVRRLSPVLVPSAVCQSSHRVIRFVLHLLNWITTCRLSVQLSKATPDGSILRSGVNRNKHSWSFKNYSNDALVLWRTPHIMCFLLKHVSLSCLNNWVQSSAFLIHVTSILRLNESLQCPLQSWLFECEHDVLLNEFVFWSQNQTAFACFVLTLRLTH